LSGGKLSSGRIDQGWITLRKNCSGRNVYGRIDPGRIGSDSVKRHTLNENMDKLSRKSFLSFNVTTILVHMR
jgi:hypothetical protein